MKITLAEDGGWGAGINRSPRVIDVDTLPQPAAEKLSRLVETAKTASDEKETAPGRARDAMTYAITVDDGDHPTVLRQSDMSMSREFAELLDWLERHFAKT